MKNTIYLAILFILLSRLSSYSQWVQTNGPEGQSPIFALGVCFDADDGTNWGTHSYPIIVFTNDRNTGYVNMIDILTYLGL
jgi:hypothetical protein